MFHIMFFSLFTFRVRHIARAYLEVTLRRRLLGFLSIEAVLPELVETLLSDLVGSTDLRYAVLTIGKKQIK